MPEFVDSWDYLELANEAHFNDGLAPNFSAKTTQKYRDHVDNDLYPNTQWIDELVKNAVHSQCHTLNFRGGAKNAKYFVSMVYYQTDGVFKESFNGKYNNDFGFERYYNLRSNIDLRVSKSTNLSIDLSGQYTHRRTANRSAESETVMKGMGATTPCRRSSSAPTAAMPGMRRRISKRSTAW